MQEDLEQLKARFTQLFGDGTKLRIVRAPGRVNLIGEHTDYNDGFVFPMAIEPEVKVVCRGRKDDIVRIASTVYPNEFVEFSLQKKIERGKPAWGNYVRGVVAELMTEDAKSAQGVAETASDVAGGFLIDEVSAEGFVLALQGELGS